MKDCAPALSTGVEKGRQRVYAPPCWIISVAICILSELIPRRISGKG